jgi:DNA-directed RNA polymerase specialized sigma24 family protein
MTSVEEQRIAATAEQIRAYIYKHCHKMSASEIADALGVHIRVVDIFYPRASR